MRTPDLSERVATLEDELQGLDSALDSRTRLLWAEIAKLKTEVMELRSEIRATGARGKTAV